MQEFGVNIVGRCALRRELISNTQWQVMFAQQDREGRKKDNIFSWNAGATPADQTLARILGYFGFGRKESCVVMQNIQRHTP